MIKHMNMKEYGYLLERYSVDFGNNIAEAIAYSRYDETGRVVERKKTDNGSTYTGHIFDNTVFYLQEKNIYGNPYRSGHWDQEPDIITLIEGYSGYDFKTIYKSQIYYKRNGDSLEMPRSSLSAIYPTHMTKKYDNLGFKFGDLWSTCYIDYKPNELKNEPREYISRITLYVYAVTDKEQRDKLTEDIDNRKDFSI